MNISGSSFEMVSDARERQSDLGQFMTPEPIAKFMASWLKPLKGEPMRILDAGAGKGSLSSALAKTWEGQGASLRNSTITLFELDESLERELSDNVNKAGFGDVELHLSDFILQSAREKVASHYSHVILNPPYKKISSKSAHRLALRKCGIETGNLYSGFVAIALQQMHHGGQLVAIIPRSFCNGPYFKPFRKQLLESAALTHIHLFESRTHAFQADGVLQENIIIRVVKGAPQSSVVVSTSAQADFHKREECVHDFQKIVYPEDEDCFIHIPSTTSSKETSRRKNDQRVSLEEIEAQISTGPVVGFRLREHLRDALEIGVAPLVYPTHFRDGRVRWPLQIGAKANAIMINDSTRKWLMPNGFYCVVRRFSSKEERHRVVASVIEPTDFPNAELLGLDNKLNVFHFNKSGLSSDFVYGLCAYLNTDIVDEEFRLFSGHTQVNATDLRRMKYPKRERLERLGSQLEAGAELSQEKICSTLEL